MSREINPFYFYFSSWLLCRFYLQFYYSSDNHGSLESSSAEQDPMRQHFSLATHPSLPIVLFSDGFLVTVVQLSADVNSASMMTAFVLESARCLKKVYEQENLDMTVADAYKLSKGKLGRGNNID